MLCGDEGFTSAIEGGREPLPEFMSNNDPLKGPVPPFVIWIVSGKSKYFYTNYHYLTKIANRRRNNLLS